MPTIDGLFTFLRLIQFDSIQNIESKPAETHLRKTHSIFSSKFFNDSFIATE